MGIRIEKRRVISNTLLYLTPPLSVLATMIAGLFVFALLGFAPLTTMYHFFVSPLTTGYGVAELFLKAAPLIMIAVGLAAGFRANVWNIGAEGQLIMGAITGGCVALFFHGQDGFWILPLMGIAAILGGMAWGAIPAFLKTRYEVNEILTSLMLTYVASLFLSVLVFGPLKDPGGFNFPQSKMFSPSATLPIVLEGTRLHVGVLLAILIGIAGWVIMARTLNGFQIRVTGLAPAAARYAGFNRNRVIWTTLLATGGLAGLAGMFEVAGPIGQLVPSISPGYGFTAIIVAFLGRLNPLGIIAAGLLMALSYIGGENAQVAVGLPKAATGLFQGMLLFFVLASDFLVRYRVVIDGRLSKSTGKEAA
jgi:general nucleoside transport system permease protein